MNKKLVETKNAPEALGPYSQAVSINGFLFLSGQIGIDPASGKIVEGGVESQARRIFKNINNVVTEAGGKMDNIVKVTVFLKNMDDFSKVNKIYAENFNKPYPARSALEVSRLPLDVDIEIESIAVI